MKQYTSEADWWVSQLNAAEQDGAWYDIAWSADHAACSELLGPPPPVPDAAVTLYRYPDGSYMFLRGFEARTISLEEGMRALGMLEPDAIAQTLQHADREVRAVVIASLGHREPD